MTGATLGKSITKSANWWPIVLRRKNTDDVREPTIAHENNIFDFTGASEKDSKPRKNFEKHFWFRQRNLYYSLLSRVNFVTSGRLKSREKKISLTKWPRNWKYILIHWSLPANSFTISPWKDWRKSTWLRHRSGYQNRRDGGETALDLLVVKICGH